LVLLLRHDLGRLGLALNAQLWAHNFPISQK